NTAVLDFHLDFPKQNMQRQASFEPEGTQIVTPELNMDQISGLDEIQLLELRWKLQDGISENLKDDTRTDSLQKSVSLYNKVLDTLHGLEINRRMDPMERLPDEIITKILFEVSKYHYSWYSCTDIKRLLTLTM
ncbi:11337_t:CDS:1, partial [Acaulospora colombiana]